MEGDLPPDAKIGSLVKRLPVYVYSDCTVREAADHMVRHGVGRLPVVRRDNPRQLAGIITRSDILSVYERRLQDSTPAAPTAWPRQRKRVKV
jgi:CBS domain-containing protein